MPLTESTLALHRSTYGAYMRQVKELALRVVFLTTKNAPTSLSNPLLSLRGHSHSTNQLGFFYQNHNREIDRRMKCCFIICYQGCFYRLCLIVGTDHRFALGRGKRTVLTEAVGAHRHFHPSPHITPTIDNP